MRLWNTVTLHAGSFRKGPHAAVSSATHASVSGKEASGELWE
jgi:hypothetical protein